MAKILVKKILVTGGAGFIASHIVDKYIAEGHSVVVVDNLLTGKKENVNKKAKFYEVDIKDAGAINKIFAKEKPEVVNHHAAIAEVVKSLRDPIPTFDTNILGTVNLLIASQAGASCFFNLLTRSKNIALGRLFGLIAIISPVFTE